jgi:hypothetical protein
MLPRTHVVKEDGGDNRKKLSAFVPSLRCNSRGRLFGFSSLCAILRCNSMGRLFGFSSLRAILRCFSRGRLFGSLCALLRCTRKGSVRRKGARCA